MIDIGNDVSLIDFMTTHQVVFQRMPGRFEEFHRRRHFAILRQEKWAPIIDCVTYATGVSRWRSAGMFVERGMLIALNSAADLERYAERYAI